jgi:glycosyltransferase involved in cell wall biosynthesis
MLALLLSDAEIRRSAGDSARQKAREHFLWPEIARQVSEVYEELLGGKGIRRQPTAVVSAKKQTRVA